ncbi:MAG: S-layer homology domain-containing protein [Oscillospiraceae bacterium]|jgi:hypothetical protein
MSKRFFALCTAGFLLIFSSAPAMAFGGDDAFPAYLEKPQWIDVSQNTWYTEEVDLCFQIGMMNGVGGGRFAPETKMTRGEVIALAARAHHRIYAGWETPSLAPVDGEWYQVYVNYLRQIGIADVVNPKGQATRLYFAKLIAKVLPREMLEPINQITSVSDIESEDVLCLYNAGILTGINSALQFNPGGAMTRAEAATMVARVARRALRRHMALPNA